VTLAFLVVNRVTRKMTTDEKNQLTSVAYKIAIKELGVSFLL